MSTQTEQTVPWQEDGTDYGRDLGTGAKGAEGAKPEHQVDVPRDHGHPAAREPAPASGAHASEPHRGAPGGFVLSQSGGDGENHDSGDSSDAEGGNT